MSIQRIGDVGLGAAQPTAGYVTFGITMDIYSHVMPSMQRDVVERFEMALAIHK